jgi:hypothetical protein
MAAYFSAERIAELNAGHDEVDGQFRALQERFVMRTYKTERGAEFAKHGFCRRIGTLVRVIETWSDYLQWRGGSTLAPTPPISRSNTTRRGRAILRRCDLSPNTRASCSGS